jgi:hypothetical protein
MTVKQLREILQEYEDTAEIVLEVEDYRGKSYYDDKNISVFETSEKQICIKGIHF